MSQLNSRKRKGDHLNNEQHTITSNRGYLSINMLNNIHTIQNNTVVTNEQSTFINHHHQTSNHQNTTNNSALIYSAQNLFQIDHHSQQNNNHVVPNKLLILNSNTNSSSGSGVDESSRSEFGASMDNLTEMVSITNNNLQRKQRHETSLGQLTKKFVGLLQDKQGVSVL